MIKKTISVGILAAISVGLPAQSNTQNYIKTVTMLDAGGSGKITGVDYYDGLGRLSEEVTDGLNTDGKCAYILHEYDSGGRLSKTWLPGVDGTSPDYREPSSVAALSQSSNGNNYYPFTQTGYDALDREISVCGAGASWHCAGKKVTRGHILNAAGSVKKYTASDGSDTPSQSGYYAEGALDGESVTDEDGKTVTVFTDFFGRKVLERRPGGVDTYFVYDLYGNLRFILSPMYQDDPDVEKYAYEYRYDKRMRRVYSRRPGCEPVCYWYDKYNCLAFLQDGPLREAGKCRFFLYDSRYRLAVQGVCKNTPADCMSACVNYTGNGGICNSGYSYVSYYGGVELVSPEMETVNYYDKYDFFNGPLFHIYNNDRLRQMSVHSAQNVGGLLTGSVTNSTDSVLLYNAFYYNRKGHPVDVRRSFPNGRMLFTRTAYTFTDKPRTVTYELRSADRVDSVKVSNVYSGVNDALLYTDISYNGGESHRVSSFGYDLLGRPSSKTLPGNAGTVAYSYNVRGWLTGISGKGYSEDIYYNSGNGTPLYNGNISSIIWRDSTQTASRGYRFTYDSMNRLTDAVYGEGSSFSDNTDRYSERGMTYTKNGALTRLLRYGRRNTDDFGLVDSLVMTLDGNRVLSVEDGAGRLVYENSFDFKSNGGSGVYEYDGNGSLSVDPYKGFAFEYDLLGNLKRTESEYTTSYVYSSTGERLSVKSKFNGCIIKPHPVFPSDWEEGGVIFNATSDDSGDSDIMDRWKKAGVPRDTEFCGPFIFEYSVLDKFLFDGGYCTFKDGQAIFHYYLTDHLGNNRAVVSEAGTVEQTTEYYPFGGIYGDVSTNSGLQPYKYNGKEFDHIEGLDLYDYGARQYDPALAVWTSVDPLADEYGDVSPYVYCHNAPINSIDTDGRDDYQINQLGYIKFKKRTNAKSTHRIFCGNFNITIGRNLVEQLVKNQNNRGTFATISNSDDAFQFFKFVADHTMVEWSLVGVKNRSGVSFKLKTNFEEGSVGNDAKNNSFILFHLHNHPWGSNPFGTKASGNYEDYKKLSPGKDVDGFYTKGDIWRLNDMYNDYKKAHPSLELSKYPKVYIYYPGDKKQKSQLFQYDLDRSKFDPYFNPNYKQIKHKVYK